MLDLTKVNWNRIYYFYLVGYYRNITEAARHVKLDQSGMSRQIMELEKQLKTSLLIRTNSGVKFTESGECVYNAACKMYESALEENQNLHIMHKSMDGPLRILTAQSIARKYVPHIPGFYSKFPSMRLYLNISRELSPSDFGNNDIAIFANFVPHPDYEYIPYKRLKQSIFASKEYLEKHGTPQKPEDLDNHKLIAFSPEISPKEGFLDFHLNIGNKAKKLRDAYFQIGAADSLIEACKQGMGIITYMNEENIKLPDNFVRILDNHYSEYLDFQFIFRKRHKEVRKIQEFINFFKDV